MTKTPAFPGRMTSRTLDTSAPIFAALGDATRLAIVARLADGTPQSITALTTGAGVTRQAVTKHLLVLDEAGLVHSVRQGRERLWALEPAGLAAARRFFDGVSAHWDQALDRLKAHVERP